MRNALILLLGMVFLHACTSDVYYQKKEDILLSVWNYGEEVVFSLSVTDTLSLYDLSLTTNHDKDFGYENYYIKITTQFPDKEEISQIFSIDLMDNFGQWNGSCGGSACNQETYLLQKFKFPSAGKYNFSLQQYGRQESLEGINSLEMKVEKHKQD